MILRLDWGSETPKAYRLLTLQEAIYIYPLATDDAYCIKIKNKKVRTPMMTHIGS